MLIKNYIFHLFLFIYTLNFLLFLFLLLKKISNKFLEKKKSRLRARYEAKLTTYITFNNNKKELKTSTYLERQVLQKLLIDYSSFLTGEARNRLLELVDEEKQIKRIKGYVASRNRWKKRIGAFEAGELAVKEVVPALLKLLEINDGELFYITAKSLIKIGGKKHLKEILERVSSGSMLEKSSVSYLVDIIEADIVDILEETMEGDSPFLWTLSLEMFGKRQYIEGVKWIDQMMDHPLKEVRIAALKGAIALGDIGEKDYLEKIIRLRGDQEWEVRAFLAKFLRTVKSSKSIEILEELMKDSNWFVRHNAAIALVKQGEEGVSTLLLLLESEDSFARDKAWEVIQKETIFNHLISRIEKESLKEKLLQKVFSLQREVT